MLPVVGEKGRKGKNSKKSSAKKKMSLFGFFSSRPRTTPSSLSSINIFEDESDDENLAAIVETSEYIAPNFKNNAEHKKLYLPPMNTLSVYPHKFSNMDSGIKNVLVNKKDGFFTSTEMTNHNTQKLAENCQEEMAGAALGNFPYKYITCVQGEQLFHPRLPFWKATMYHQRRSMRYDCCPEVEV